MVGFGKGINETTANAMRANDKSQRAKQQHESGAFSEQVQVKKALVEKSIIELGRRWDFFLKQEGNYMYLANLENGLRNVLRDIRTFNIQHPQHVGATASFDLIMLAAKTLSRFIVAKPDEKQDGHSVPLKLAAWRDLDEFGVRLLRGLGWQYNEAKSAIERLSALQDELEGSVGSHLPHFTAEPWLAETRAALQKCVERTGVY